MVFLRFWPSVTTFTEAAMVMTIASSLLVPVTLAKSAIAQTGSTQTQPPRSIPVQTSPVQTSPVQASPAQRSPAQTFPDTWRRSAVPAGTLIPVRYDKAEKIILKRDETLPVTLTVTRDVLTARGTVLIPAGSQIEGKLQPVAGGTQGNTQGNTQGGIQFVTENVILQNNRKSAIDAISSPITKTETISKRSNPNILRGAAIGGGAAAILSEIFGRIDPLKVIGGAGLGVLAEVLLRGHQEVEVVVVEPATDIDLRLRSDFALN